MDRHIPVLLDEVMRLLAPRPGETAVDLTAGLGGHSVPLAKAVTERGGAGRVVLVDLDEDNLRRASGAVEAAGIQPLAIRANFARAAEELRARGLRADVVLADLGFSSGQMDDPARGFSFATDGPLDMRLDRSSPLIAADLVNGLSERELADVIHNFGEEPLARKIARKVAQTRQVEPIRSTARLARLVVEAYGPRARSSRLHPATRTFMALRIAVNDELGALRTLLEEITRGAEEVSRGGWLNPGARVAIISFHSLEDRLVKHAFADLERRDLAMRLTRKPIGPSEAEVGFNPRSRSAKLRAAWMRGPEHKPSG